MLLGHIAQRRAANLAQPEKIRHVCVAPQIDCILRETNAQPKAARQMPEKHWAGIRSADFGLRPRLGAQNRAIAQA